MKSVRRVHTVQSIATTSGDTPEYCVKCKKALTYTELKFARCVNLSCALQARVRGHTASQTFITFHNFFYHCQLAEHNKYSYIYRLVRPHAYVDSYNRTKPAAAYLKVSVSVITYGCHFVERKWSRVNFSQILLKLKRGGRVLGTYIRSRVWERD